MQKSVEIREKTICIHFQPLHTDLIKQIFHVKFFLDKLQFFEYVPGHNIFCQKSLIIRYSNTYNYLALGIIKKNLYINIFFSFFTSNLVHCWDINTM